MSAGRSGHAWRQAKARVKRSGGPCWICGQLIDYELKTPDPGSFEVDHKVSLKAGGDPLDMHNLAASHRSCNRAKSDGPMQGTKQVPTSRRWL